MSLVVPFTALLIAFGLFALERFAQTRLYRHKRWLQMACARFVRADNGQAETLDGLAGRFKEKQVVFFGELHQQQPVINAQMAVLTKLSEQAKSSTIALVFEMFNIRQQALLDGFMAGRLTLEDVQKEYENSSEGFDVLHHYGQLLISAKKLKNVTAIAGFVPRELAKGMIDAPEETLQQIENENLFDVNFYRNHPGSDQHYATFVGLINGIDADPNDITEITPSKYKPIFRAQLLKDASLAARISEQIRMNRRVLVICGSGHSDWGFGAPERVDISRDQTFIISARVDETCNYGNTAAQFKRCETIFFFE